MKKSTKKLKYLADLQTNLPQNTEPNELSQIIRKKSTKNTSSKKVNIMLLMISSSYVILDLPYFISWLCLFYYEKYFVLENDNFGSLIDYSIYSNFIIGFINLTEVFYLLNFAIHFYIYCFSSKNFDNQFKNMFKCIK